MTDKIENYFNSNSNLLQKLKKHRFFLTGGTGFFGKSFLDIILKLNSKFQTEIEVTILTRNYEVFLKRHPKYQQSCINYIKGDIATFEFPEKLYDSILHFAATVSAQINSSESIPMLNKMIDGSRRILDFTVKCRAKRFLLASSGAVYGKQPSSLTHIQEDYTGAPLTLDLSSVYGEGKRIAEMFGTSYSDKYGFQHKIARCFAFVGPHLDFNESYAIGNFIRDAISKKEILISGDGRPFRSYLYSDDLIVWLLKIHFDGKSMRPYNVGSDQEISIFDLAKRIQSKIYPDGNIHVVKKPDLNQPVARYVPSIERARVELGLDVFTSLDEAIDLTLNLKI